MSTITTHERPGVYSAYEASSVVQTSSAGSAVGIAGISSGGTAGQLYELTSYEEAVTAFGQDDSLTNLVKLLFLNGASAVAAVPVTGESGYADAFSLLGAYEDLPILVCDSTTLTVQQALRDAVEEASGLRRERIAVVPGGADETPAELVIRAAGLNSERAILVASDAVENGAALAAAAAGAIAGETDPAVPLGGAELSGLTAESFSYTDTQIDTLIQGGVTPAECVGGEVSIVRGVTTRTTTGGVSDTTWREMTTIRIVDDVIPTVRDSLRAKFTRTKNTEQTRAAIRSQVIMELENKLSREIISDYGEVTASAVTDNPTVCLVEFSFTVTYGLNQIWLSAKITV